MDRILELVKIMEEYKSIKGTLARLKRHQETAKSVSEGEVLRCSGVTFHSEYVAHVSIGRKADAKLLEKLLEVSIDYYTSEAERLKAIIEQAEDALPALEEIQRQLNGK